MDAGAALERLLEESRLALEALHAAGREPLRVQEVGAILSVAGGVVRVQGLPNARSEELLSFPGNRLGMVYNLDPHELGVILLDENQELEAGAEVNRTGRVLDVPVGEAFLGRVIDPFGRPLDGGRPLRALQRLPVERRAPAIMNRAPVNRPLHTGIKVIDALVPVGRGQRELILGDRQTGKTAVAVDTIINQREQDMICFYCAIGQRGASVAKVIHTLRERHALDYTTVVVASGEDPPGRQFVAPYAATSMAEYFMERGHDVLIVYDDLTRHARAYRELSLLLRRPPGREAFPGDIFYIHSRLLERATHLKPEFGGGSLTSLPIVETELQNVAAYIPTNLISITDGQIYLSPTLFQKGLLPAVDPGKSVSRVGGKAQLPAYRAVAGDLRLVYSQFEELEAFARFGTRLDEQTRELLERGRRVREVLKQRQGQPRSVAEQIAALFSVTRGLLDSVPLDAIADAEEKLISSLRTNFPELWNRLQAGRLEPVDEESLQRHIAQLPSIRPGGGEPRVS